LLVPITGESIRGWQTKVKPRDGTESTNKNLKGGGFVRESNTTIRGVNRTSTVFPLKISDRDSLKKHPNSGEEKFAKIREYYSQRPKRKKIKVRGGQFRGACAELTKTEEGPKRIVI